MKRFNAMILVLALAASSLVIGPVPPAEARTPGLATIIEACINGVGWMWIFNNDGELQFTAHGWEC